MARHRRSSGWVTAPRIARRPEDRPAGLYWALAPLLAAWVAAYALWVVLPAARATTHGFAAYYTAARLLLNEPETMAHIYDNDWFAAQIVDSGIHGVYDIFNIQPPTMGLMLLPLVPLPAGAAGRFPAR